MSLRTRKGKNYSWRCTGLLTVALRGSRWYRPRIRLIPISLSIIARILLIRRQARTPKRLKARGRTLRLGTRRSGAHREICLSHISISLCGARSLAVPTLSFTCGPRLLSCMFVRDDLCLWWCEVVLVK
jgi:hypothetical protein